MDPEILIVDEALSVGDEVFQRKCFSRIEQIRGRGATILFVSHGAGTIVDLCTRAVLLDAGTRLLTGEPKQVVSYYQRMLYAPDDRVEEIRAEIKELDADQERSAAASLTTPGASSRMEKTAVEASTKSGYFDPNLKPESTVEYVQRGARIFDPVIVDDQGQLVNVLIPCEIYQYVYKVVFQEQAFGVTFGSLIKSISGVELGGIVSHGAGDAIDYVEAGQVASVAFRFRNILNPGSYFVNAGVIGVLDGEKLYLHRVLDAVMFRVDPVLGIQSTGYLDLAAAPNCSLSWRQVTETSVDGNG